MRPDISICLLTWNRAAFLERCLTQLFSALTPTDKGGLTREILIMDNASTDHTPEVLLKFKSYPDIRIMRSKKNLRFAAYKRLFFHARGKIIIDVDDDILSFPKDFDKTLFEYMEVYRDYGFLACNVIQNDKTDGARPRNATYVEDRRGDMVVEEGPTGGWCSAFRRRDYLLIKLLIFLFKMNAKTPEDAYIASLCMRLHKRMGLIKNTVVFHACGPVYSRENNYLDRDIEKHMAGESFELARLYEAEKRHISYEHSSALH